MRYIAYTTKGLEHISEKEIIHKTDAEIKAIGDKRVIFESDVNFENLSALRTVDDIGILLHESTDVRDISQLQKLISEIKLDIVREQIEGYRKLDNTFSLTVSHAGSSIDVKEIIKILSGDIQIKYKWQFTEFDHTNFDIRVFIDHKNVIISVRITKESLHHRLYKGSAKLGSLKPTIAASMVLFATQFQDRLSIVDNFCGSGTILCESVLAGDEVYGGDIDPESVQITINNLKNLHYKAEGKVRTLDATRPNWNNEFFDCAISNLPWDKQIAIQSITTLYEDTVREYARILKPDGRLCMLVSKPDLFIKYIKKYFPKKPIQQVKIGLLGQTPSIILVGNITATNS